MADVLAAFPPEHERVCEAAIVKGGETVTRWILAFDAGCAACQDIVDRVQVVAGPLVETRHLADAEVQELRHAAMAEEDLPWIPTLLAVQDGRVRAWTGSALSRRLARLLGPARSVRVVRALREGERNLPAPSRRRLLQAIPGVAVGAFVLSGGTAFADTGGSPTIRHLKGSDPRLRILRRQLVGPSQGQVLGPADFSWETAAQVKNKNGENVIVVPARDRHQSPTERIFLTASYQPENDVVGGFDIQLYERESAETTSRFRINFVDPGKRRIVGMSVDEDRGEAWPIIYPLPDLAGQPAALQGFWECFGRCLRDLWDQLPGPIRVACASACGACIWSKVWVACVPCAACVKGYAVSCRARC